MLLVRQNVLKNYAKASLAIASLMVTSPLLAASSETTPNLVNMITSLIIVIGLIFAVAMIAKRFNIGVGGQGAIKLIATLPVGTKERLIIVEISEQQYLLGVTSAQVRLIERLEHKVASNSTAQPLPEGLKMDSLLKYIKKGTS